MTNSQQDMALKTRTKNLVGLQFGRLTVLEFAGYILNRATWLCKCSCGVEKNIKGNSLLTGAIKSCGCLIYENKQNISHGLSKSKEYRSWANIKERCYNPNKKEFERYGAVGIVMDEDFRNSFESFINEIGMCPNYDQNWSVERIDNEKGYVRGNIKWATNEEQARNHGLRRDNKTGVNGVYYRELPTGHCYYVATLSEPTEKGFRQVSKYFSVTKLGDRVAFEEAKRYRENQMKQLELLGVVYSKKHGLRRNCDND